MAHGTPALGLGPYSWWGWHLAPGLLGVLQLSALQADTDTEGFVLCVFLSQDAERSIFTKTKNKTQKAKQGERGERKK